MTTLLLPVMGAFAEFERPAAGQEVGCADIDEASMAESGHDGAMADRVFSRPRWRGLSSGGGAPGHGVFQRFDVSAAT